MTKPISTAASELEALMNDLDDMLAEHDAAQPQPEEPMTEENQVVADPIPEETVAEIIAEQAPPPVDHMAVESLTATGSPVGDISTGTVQVVDPEPAEEPPEAVYAAHATTPVASPAPPKPTPTGLAHYVDPDQFRRDTAISEHNLDQAMLEQSGLRAYYNAQAAYAEAQAARAKAKFEILEAKLYEEHRKALNKDAADTGAKVTEKLIENHVKMDDRWLKGKSYMIEAQTIADVNKGISYSMADRRDMLIQLGSDRREEFKGQTRILAADAEKQSLADRARNAGKGH